MMPKFNRIQREWALACAERVAHLSRVAMPDDDRVEAALAAVRRWLDGGDEAAARSAALAALKAALAARDACEAEVAAQAGRSAAPRSRPAEPKRLAARVRVELDALHERLDAANDEGRTDRRVGTGLRRKWQRASLAAMAAYSCAPPAAPADAAYWAARALAVRPEVLAEVSATEVAWQQQWLADALGMGLSANGAVGGRRPWRSEG